MIQSAVAVGNFDDDNDNDEMEVGNTDDNTRCCINNFVYAFFIFRTQNWTVENQLKPFLNFNSIKIEKNLFFSELFRSKAKN